MNMMLSALSGIFLPIMLGMISRNGEYIPPKHRPVIQMFAVRIAIPCMVFSSLRNIELSTAGQFIPMASSLLFFMGISWLIAWGLIHLTRGNPWVNLHRRELLLMFYAGNIGHICWKLHEILLGPEGLQRGIFYTSFYWPFLMLYALATVRVFGLHKTHDMDKKNIAYSMISLLTMLFTGLALGITETEIPFWLDSFISTFGNMAIPLILFGMGLSISLKEAFKSVKALIPYLLIRGVIWIGISLLMIQLSIYDGISRQVLLINSLAPLGVTPIVITDMFGLDSEFVAHSITVSTVFYIILVLPLLFLLWG